MFFRDVHFSSFVVGHGTLAHAADLPPPDFLAAHLPVHFDELILSDGSTLRCDHGVKFPGLLSLVEAPAVVLGGGDASIIDASQFAGFGVHLEHGEEFPVAYIHSDDINLLTAERDAG